MPKLIDLSRQQFGKLTVLERANNDNQGKPCWKCQCTCGNITTVRGSSLRQNQTKSCGCQPKFIDLTGQIFNRLTVIKRTQNDKNRTTRWICKCICGNISIVRGTSLKNGRTQSCGCLNREYLAKKRTKIYNLSKTPEYAAWGSMLNRCFNPKNKAFKNYGGRGIAVCEEWKTNFLTFYCQMGERPSPKHSIDRIDNESDYTLNNCRWATQTEQANNNRRNFRITLHDWTMNLNQWATFVGMSRYTLQTRLRSDWPPAKAIFQPVRYRKK